MEERMNIKYKPKNLNKKKAPKYHQNLLSDSSDGSAIRCNYKNRYDEERADCNVDKEHFPRLDNVDKTCAIGHCYKNGNVVNDEVVRNRMTLIVSDKIEKDLRESNSNTRTWVRERSYS
ncbi:hypothetical protein F8M41_001628 [Gigaspora margarita]|uniref:Uncharacterized protein n=1 Tax=Gigaspora margarita TaxID=4874 RepID=A0A8H4AYX4_GIGMA|nr:hypothetical protein F8M41_001628 [Gigaspora margarita]